VIDTLQPLLRRILAIGILCVLPLLTWLAVAEPLIALVVDRQTEIAAASERLERLRTTISRIPELERRAAADRQRLDDAGGIWSGTSEAAIATSMQDQIREAISSSVGIIKSTSQVRGADVDALQTIRIRFSVEGTLDTVLKTLEVIETARPAMFVDNMTIAAPAITTPDKSPLLSLDFEVIGYTRKPGS